MKIFKEIVTHIDPAQFLYSLRASVDVTSNDDGKPYDVVELLDLISITDNVVLLNIIYGNSETRSTGVIEVDYNNFLKIYSISEEKYLIFPLITVRYIRYEFNNF